MTRSESASPPFLDLAGVRLEYAEALASWQWPIPDGHEMPARSGAANESGEVGRWAIGSGWSEVFFNWSSGVVAAARLASERGDLSSTHALLDQIAAAHGVAVQAGYVEDPNSAFANEVLAPARESDFRTLTAILSIQ